MKLSELVEQARRKLPYADRFAGCYIDVPILKPLEVDPRILNLNLDLVSNGHELPFDLMDQTWVLRFKKIDNQWAFHELL